MFDLNKLVPRGSTIKLMLALNINDGGEIATWGFVRGFETHAVLLIPSAKQ